MSSPFQAIATLSTAHLTENLGHDGAITAHPLVAVDRISHGYFWILTPEIKQDLLDNIETLDDYVLYGIARWAQAHGLEYIRFDEAGEEVNELPAFDW